MFKCLKSGNSNKILVLRYGAHHTISLINNRVIKRVIKGWTLFMSTHLVTLCLVFLDKHTHVKFWSWIPQHTALQTGERQQHE